MKYFLHDSSAFSDEKITELYMHFGYEGIGLFFTALEKLALQEKPIKTSILKKQLNVGKRLEKCWNFMETLEILSSNNGETFNKQLLNFSEKYQIKKEKNKERLANWRTNNEKKENETHYKPVRNTPKDKISKVKESKGNINTSEETSQVKKKVLSPVDEIMDMFYKINPTLNWGNKTIRGSAEKLINLYGLEKTKTMAEQIISVQGKPYAPVATTPYDMYEKLAKFKIYFDGLKKTDNERRCVVC